MDAKGHEVLARVVGERTGLLNPERLQSELGGMYTDLRAVYHDLVARGEEEPPSTIMATSMDETVCYREVGQTAPAVNLEIDGRDARGNVTITRLVREHFEVVPEEGPELAQYKGRDVGYELAVTHDGDIESVCTLWSVDCDTEGGGASLRLEGGRLWSRITLSVSEGEDGKVTYPQAASRHIDAAPFFVQKGQFDRLIDAMRQDINAGKVGTPQAVDAGTN